MARAGLAFPKRISGKRLMEGDERRAAAGHGGALLKVDACLLG